MSKRPVGHVTELIRELEGWARKRRAKRLDVKPLERSILYLEEYRQLLNAATEVRSQK